jgi:PAS domain S-box-containing protein
VDTAHILLKRRTQIIEDWVKCLHTCVSPNYSAQPLAELFGTISNAADANFLALVKGDFSAIDTVVETIGQMRFKAGFTLSEVQKAFELYRTVLIPILAVESEGKDWIEALDRLNAVLSYTIHRFSDYFQALSEKEIRHYAQTLEKKVEERTRELALSEMKYRTLVEEMRDGYFVNRREKMIFANKAFCDMHGYELKEVIGRHYTDFVAPESIQEVQALYQGRVVDGQSKEQYVYYRLHKDGRRLPTENRVTLTFYQGQMAAIGVSRDITERMEIEKRIREAERLAHIGQLTTSLAHEIRNPLSAARMSIQMLLKNPVFTGNDRRRLEILSGEVTRLNGIVTEMLDFAKPIKYEFKSFSVGEVIESCLDAIDARIKEKSIEVEKTFSRGLPKVRMDPEKMEQAIINLCLNSVEAVQHKGKIGITVGWEKGRRNMVAVTITDDGVGVAAEDLPYVFDPFFSKKARGTGLGLANAKRVIEAHGGEIRVTQGVRQGVCVRLTIPGTAERRRGKKGAIST